MSESTPPAKQTDQLTLVVNDGDALSHRLALEGRFIDATIVSGLVLTVRSLSTKIKEIVDLLSQNPEPPNTLNSTPPAVS